MNVNIKRHGSHLPWYMMLIGTLGILAFKSVVSKNDIVGQWYTEKNEAVVEVTEKDGIYTGRIISLQVPLDENRQPRTDIKNKNEVLRKRPLVGAPVFYGMKYNSSESRWEGGKVYEPNMGHEANCVITLENINKMKVKGFVGFEWVGQSQIWIRKTK
jgi:uncharacterized protein (DUF2147 family)